MSFSIFLYEFIFSGSPCHSHSWYTCSQCRCRDLLSRSRSL